MQRWMKSYDFFHLFLFMLFCHLHFVKVENTNQSLPLVIYWSVICKMIGKLHYAKKEVSP